MKMLSVLLVWIMLLCGPTLAGTSLAYQSERMTARLITAENSVTPDAGTLSAALQIDLADGWKTYWKAPGAVGYAPELDWSGSSNLLDAELFFPAPTRFEAFDIENYGYEKAVTFPLQLILAEVGTTTVLNLSANILVCAELCVPEMFDLSVTLLAGTGGLDAASAEVIGAAADTIPTPPASANMGDMAFWIDDARSEVQVAASSGQPFGDAVQVFLDMGPDAAFGAPSFAFSGDRRSVVARLPILTSPPQIAPVEITLRDGVRAAAVVVDRPTAGPFETTASGLWSIILIALLGGLILNIMPCVLPVLTVKFASAMKAQDQSSARVRTGFLVSALGVLSFMWALALVLIALRAGGGQIGWGVQFQNPVFLGLMIAIMTLFAANMTGLFEITLPQRLNTSMARMEDGPGLLADYATGALAAVLATPCSAPFLGTAVTFALAGRATDTLAIFTALGVGLALPYLAVAARPSLVQALPKPGAWMVKVKWIMAGLLAATAIWLGSVLLGVAGWTVVLAVFALLGLGLFALTMARGKALPAAFIVAALAVPLVVQPTPAPIDDNADWRVFDRTAIAAEVAEGRVVFVDVTASWCLTCKANKARVLDRAPVAGALQADDVVAMRGDWTGPDPAILSYLQDNGRFGIPFNMVYGPNAPQGIALPEFVTVDAVMDALAAARL